MVVIVDGSGSVARWVAVMNWTFADLTVGPLVVFCTSLQKDVCDLVM